MQRRSPKRRRAVVDIVEGLKAHELEMARISALLTEVAKEMSEEERAAIDRADRASLRYVTEVAPREDILAAHEYVAARLTEEGGGS